MLTELCDELNSVSFSKTHKISPTMESFKSTNPVLARVLKDIKNAQNPHSASTAHNMYTSGVFEDVAPEGDLKKD